MTPKRKVSQENDNVVQDKSKRVLALSMRPKQFADMVGQNNLISSMENTFSVSGIPHFFLISGPVGSGKTTFAKILANMIQQEKKVFDSLDWSLYHKYDIQEINAANKNGIDDIRSLVEKMRYQPIAPSKAKVIILDEAHQLSNSAQNALLTETEDVSDNVYYIFCTSQISKIISGLQRRAYVVTPRALNKDSVNDLVKKARIKYASSISNESRDGLLSNMDIAPLISSFIEYGVSSPGLILQAAEKFFSGISPQESITLAEDSKFDILLICRSVLSGDWKQCSQFLTEVTKSDVYSLRARIVAYLKTTMLSSTGPKALNIGKAIRCICDNQSDEPAAFLATLCIVCELHLYVDKSGSALKLLKKK